MKSIKIMLCFCLIGLCLSSCTMDDFTPKPIDETEEITDITLMFTDSLGHETSYTYTDPKFRSNDYQDPVITLAENATYTVALKFYNKSDPDNSVDVTQEVMEKKDDHFAEYRFFDADVHLVRTDGASTTDDRGIQIGLFTKWTTGNPAQGAVQVTLIHEPETKNTDDPDGNHTGGETDAQVTFPLHVQ